jgi:hypothetical protein
MVNLRQKRRQVINPMHAQRAQHRIKAFCGIRQPFLIVEYFACDAYFVIKREVRIAIEHCTGGFCGCQVRDAG